MRLKDRLITFLTLNALAIMLCLAFLLFYSVFSWSIPSFPNITLKGFFQLEFVLLIFSIVIE